MQYLCWRLNTIIYTLHVNNTKYENLCNDWCHSCIGHLHKSHWTPPRRQSFTREVTASHLVSPSRLQVAHQSYILEVSHIHLCDWHCSLRRWSFLTAPVMLLAEIFWVIVQNKTIHFWVKIITLNRWTSSACHRIQYIVYGLAHTMGFLHVPVFFVYM